MLTNSDQETVVHALRFSSWLFKSSATLCVVGTASLSTAGGPQRGAERASNCPTNQLAGLSKFRKPELLNVAIAQSGAEALASALYSTCQGATALPLLEAR